MSACARPRRSSRCRQTDYLRDTVRCWCLAVHRRRQSALLMAPQLRGAVPAGGALISVLATHCGRAPASTVGSRCLSAFGLPCTQKSGQGGLVVPETTTAGTPLSARSEPARTRLSLSECANPCAPEARGSKHRLWKVSFRGRLDGACMTEREDQPAFAPTAQAVFDPLADIFRLLRLSRAGQQTGSPPRS